MNLPGRQAGERDADKLLRDLFKQSGPIMAPEGFDARILQRIAVTPRTSLVPDKPLLPKWAWAGAGALLIGLAFLPGGSSSPQWTSHLPSFDWNKVLSSPWLMMGLATCVALLGLDTWLTKQRLAHQSR